jgi:hypothetical protein
MEAKETRRSDRISVEFRIQIAGIDAAGQGFLDEGRTTVVERHGGKILFARKLAPEQEIDVRCVESGKEVLCRVVGQIGEGAEGFFYGISSLDPNVNLWAMEFPASAGPRESAGRVVLDCPGCHARALTYLDELELEVLEANRTLSRHCKRCGDTTLWRKSFSEAPLPALAEPQKKPRDRRPPLRVTACVRSRQFGEDIVVSRNVSRGGFCFESARRHDKGEEVETAIPYSPAGGNIFVRGMIAHTQHLPHHAEATLYVYGLAYLRGHKD